MPSTGELHITGDELLTTFAGCDVIVRLGPDDRGRWRPVEVTIRNPDGVPAEAVRSLPLPQLEASANSAMVAWVLQANAALRDQGEKVPGPELVEHPRPPLKLRVPSGRGKKPDAFYERVAKAYQWLAAHGGKPASVLAEQNNVPVTTVHRWVKEARARGLLPPGQKGRTA